MKVTDTFHVKNRGYVVVVEDLPEAAVRIGDVVRQGEHSWEVKGVEMMHTGCFGGSTKEKWGFIVEFLHGGPECPERGELTL